MNQYRMDYVSLHDESGRPTYRTSTTLVDYVPAMKFLPAYWAFVLRTKVDAQKLNAALSFDFYVNRARHYEVLYQEVPAGLGARLNYYRMFFLKMFTG